MDKSWINLNDRRLRQYKDGVTAFINFAHENNPQKEKIRCPCRYCANVFFQTYSIVEDHLLINGMQTSFIEWTCHGETSQNFSDADLGISDVNDLNNANEEVDEMQEILEDLHRGTFMNYCPNISPNEEGDNIINKDETAIFDRLLKDAQRDLYPGSELSMLSALVKLLHIKVINRWTNKSFNMIHEFIKSIFPKGETLSSSYYESRKILSDLGLGCEKIHACKNDCSLFWKDYEDKEECPECMNLYDKKLSRIELFKEEFTDKEKKWVSEDCRAKYEKMIEIRQKIIDDGGVVDEIIICADVLGETSLYIRGLGYGPKPIKKTKIIRSNASSEREIELESSLKVIQEKYEEHSKIIKSQQKTIDWLKMIAEKMGMQPPNDDGPNISNEENDDYRYD